MKILFIEQLYCACMHKYTVDTLEARVPRHSEAILRQIYEDVFQI